MTFPWEQSRPEQVYITKRNRKKLANQEAAWERHAATLQTGPKPKTRTCKYCKATISFQRRGKKAVPIGKNGNPHFCDNTKRMELPREPLTRKQKEWVRNLHEEGNLTLNQISKRTGVPIKRIPECL